MGYVFKPLRSIDSEVKRIAERQLTLAIEQLRRVGDSRSDAAIHEARRHVKKVRALLHLVQPALGGIYHDANQEMRTANHMLAPIADGRAVIGTLQHLKKTYRAQFDRHTLASIRAVLADRAVHIDHKALLDRVLPRTASILRRERGHVDMWDVDVGGFRTVSRGLERTFRRARKSLARAAAHPTPDNYHRWRRRVKDLWFEVRLIERRCGGGLAHMQQRLEALDGCLGEYHNVVLIEQLLTSEALVSRLQAARCLTPLHRYQLALRHRALGLGRDLFAAKPRLFVRRVRQMWKAAAARQLKRELKAPWPRAA